MTSNKGLGEFDELRGQDEKMLSALRDFRASVHAWSEGEFSRPRRVVSLEHRNAWRRSVIWALSLVMAAGVAGTGVYEHHQRAELARQVQVQREMEQKRQLEAQKAKEAEEDLARIDRDISREVPSAMEPLTQFTDDSQ
jgi:hypothetical protein